MVFPQIEFLKNLVKFFYYICNRAFKGNARFNKWKQFLFDWVNNQIDENLIKEKPFDFVISIGHELSFSCDINKGLFEISRLTKKWGILIFMFGIKMLIIL